MRGLICDRCGKIMPLFYDKRTYITLVNHDEDGDEVVPIFDNLEHPDLCDDCVKSLKDWFGTRVYP